MKLVPITYIPNQFRSLSIKICDLFEFWCLRFVIFNTLVSYSIRPADFQAGGSTDTWTQKPAKLATDILAASTISLLASTEP